MARRVLFQPPAGAAANANGSTEAVADRAPADGEVALDATDIDSSSAVATRPAAIQAIVQEDGPAEFSERLRRQTLICAEATIRKLAEVGYLNDEDANGILSSFGYYVNDLPGKASVLDILSFLVTIKLESKDEKAVKEIRQLTDVLKSSIPEKIEHMGFAHLNDTPGSLYHGHPRVFEICSTMMCPIIQNTEADFFVICSVNPITASTAAALVSHELERATGTKPFTFVMTTDSNAWNYLCDKHFGQ